MLCILGPRKLGACTHKSPQLCQLAVPKLNMRSSLEVQWHRPGDDTQVKSHGIERGPRLILTEQRHIPDFLLACFPRDV